MASSEHIANGRAACGDGLAPRTVVCSPHFDDAVLSCWSAFDRDPGCAVVNVFTGAPADGFSAWYDRKTGASSSASRMRNRALEDRDALSVAGKTPINLGLLEAQYRLRESPALHALLRAVPPLRLILERPSLQALLFKCPPPEPEQIADAVMQAVPTATSFYVPAGIGGHPDHVLVRWAGSVLASRGMDIHLYADVPYAVRYGWPAWIVASQAQRQADRATALWARYLDALPLGDMIGRATVIRLTEDESARKADAIRRYASQARSLAGAGGRSWLQGVGLEVFWSVTAEAVSRDPAQNAPADRERLDAAREGSARSSRQRGNYSAGL